jgi:hypothetical protein
MAGVLAPTGSLGLPGSVCGLDSGLASIATKAIARTKIAARMVFVLD